MRNRMQQIKRIKKWKVVEIEWFFFCTEFHFLLEQNAQLIRPKCNLNRMIMSKTCLM